jgi:shikimate dehydrogenase
VLGTANPEDLARGGENGLARRLGVVGWPVAHSRSPAMQEAAFAALGLEGFTYQRLPVPEHLFAETVRALPAAGFLGANVTIPHKEAALAVATDATAAAQAIGAANILTFADGRIEAENTDAPALLAALPATPRTALVLGAGGSARAAAYALREAGARVRVHNRTRDRAERLAADLGVQVAPEPGDADLLVNCTSVGLADADRSPVEEVRAAVVIDFVYADRETALIRQAKAKGATTVDGLELLVRQGALSLTRWTGRPPPLDAMRAAVRAP